MNENGRKPLGIMSGVDQKYISEADPARSHKRSSNFWLITIPAAVLAIIIISINLVLFLPYNKSFTPPDVSQYADSEYYEVIARLETVNAYNKFKRQLSPYNNNFEALVAGGINILKGGFLSSARKDTAFMPPSAETPIADMMNESTSAPAGSDQRYEEVTDNQVFGVNETDLIKRSDKYIYYLRNYRASELRAYSIAGNESKLVGSIEIGESSINGIRPKPVGMYLSSDCKTVTVISVYSGAYAYSYGNDYIRDFNGQKDILYGNENLIFVNSFDVSDPSQIVKKHEVRISGEYVSSRAVDGKLLIVSNYQNEGNCSYEQPDTFLPKIDAGNGGNFKVIGGEDIVVADNLTAKSFAVLTLLSENDLTLLDEKAFMSYSAQIYATADRIYLTGISYEYTDFGINSMILRNVAVTEITCVSLSDEGFELLGNIKVDGYIKDQYSLDEYDGILRVATTVSRDKGLNASLYCIDTENWTVAGGKENFAPWGEDVKSVRFDKTEVYVCTSIRQTDPVFFFDLSDIQSIKVKDTGTIDGFSSSLVNMGDGYLLGIGIGKSGVSLKLEVYKEGEDKVESVDIFEFDKRYYVYYSNDYKAYYIDRENKLIGLSVRIHSGYRRNDEINLDGNFYLLVSFDGQKLKQEALIQLNDEVIPEAGRCRGVYIDGWLYIMHDDVFIVAKPFNSAE